MKDQYFGDINDYRKYGLLRALQASTDTRLLVAWMLTANDSGPDGGSRSYLEDPNNWAKFDRVLFDGLVALLRSAPQPSVSLLEKSNLLPRSAYYSEIVPDQREARERWRSDLWQAASQADLVFIDPDNGIEVPSRPVGHKGSCKYITWCEIEGLWKTGCSLLIYQHFRRERRDSFTKRIAAALRERTGAPYVEALRTAHVLFLLAAQPQHAARFREAISTLTCQWGDQITPLGLSDRTVVETGRCSPQEALHSEGTMNNNPETKTGDLSDLHGRRPNKLDEQHVMQNDPADLTIARHSLRVAQGMLIVSSLALVLSFLQFSSARAERKEASRALGLANQAQEASARAESRILTHESAIEALREELAANVAISRINDLSRRAEAGEREAFLELQDYAFNDVTDIVAHQYAQKRFIRISSLFSGDTILDPVVASAWHGTYKVDVARVPEYLNADLFNARASGVATVSKLRLTRYLPDLVEMAIREPDLHVVQLIIKTLEQEFKDFEPRVPFSYSDFIMRPEEGRSKFAKQWEAFGDEILSRDKAYRGE